MIAPDHRVAIVAQMAATIYPEMLIYYDSDRAEKIAVRVAMDLYNRVLALTEPPAKGSALPPPSPESSNEKEGP